MSYTSKLQHIDIKMMRKCKSKNLFHFSIEVMHIEMTRPDHSTLEIARTHFFHNLANFSLKTWIIFLHCIFTIKFLLSSMISTIFLRYMIDSNFRIIAVVYLSVFLSLYLSTYLSGFFSTLTWFCLSFYLSVFVVLSAQIVVFVCLLLPFLVMV